MLHIKSYHRSERVIKFWVNKDFGIIIKLETEHPPKQRARRRPSGSLNASEFDLSYLPTKNSNLAL